MRHVIGIGDFTRSDIEPIVRKGIETIPVARQRQIGHEAWERFPERIVTGLFLEPSTRTRGSYQEATQLNGWTWREIIGAEATSLIKGESLANMARMLASQGAHVIVARSKIEGMQRFWAELLEREGYCVSVQNAGDGTNQHPTQTFLDLVTILNASKRLDNLKIGFFGDLKYGRTVHSLLRALALFPHISVVLASDPETALQDSYKRLFRGNITEGDSLEVLRGCHFVYGARVQRERFVGDEAALIRAENKFCLTRASLDMLGEDVYIMHPMPFLKEFSNEIFSDPRFIVYQQAWHGIPTRMALLELGFAGKEEKTLDLNNPPADCARQVLADIPLEVYFQGRQGKDDFFRPVRNGVVVDHITHGLGMIIMRYLIGNGLINGGVRHLIENVPSQKYGRKDVLVLQSDAISDEGMETIAALSPQVTFNIIRGGTFRKEKIRPPKILRGVGRCPNANCVTNHESEAVPRFVNDGNGNLTCWYCEKEYKVPEVLPR